MSAIINLVEDCFRFFYGFVHVKHSMERYKSNILKLTLSNFIWLEWVTILLQWAYFWFFRNLSFSIIFESSSLYIFSLSFLELALIIRNMTLTLHYQEQVFAVIHLLCTIRKITISCPYAYQPLELYHKSSTQRQKQGWHSPNQTKKVNPMASKWSSWDRQTQVSPASPPDSPKTNSLRHIK